MNFSTAEVLRAKHVVRAAAAAAPVADKLRTLERLRERDRVIKRAVAAHLTGPCLLDNPRAPVPAKLVP